MSNLLCIFELTMVDVKAKGQFVSLELDPSRHHHFVCSLFVVASYSMLTNVCCTACSAKLVYPQG